MKHVGQAEHLLEENFDLVAAELVDKFTAAYCDQLLQCALSNSHNKVHRESRCLQVYQSEW